MGQSGRDKSKTIPVTPDNGTRSDREVEEEEY